MEAPHAAQRCWMVLFWPYFHGVDGELRAGSRVPYIRLRQVLHALQIDISKRVCSTWGAAQCFGRNAACTKCALWLIYTRAIIVRTAYRAIGFRYRGNHH